MKKTTRRLHLGRQTIAPLTNGQLGRANGANAQDPCSNCCNPPTYHCITTQASAYQCPSLIYSDCACQSITM